MIEQFYTLHLTRKVMTSLIKYHYELIIWILLKQNK